MNDHLDCYIQVPMYSSLTPVLELPKTLFYVREMLRSKYLDPFKLSLMTLLKKEMMICSVGRMHCFL